MTKYTFVRKLLSLFILASLSYSVSAQQKYQSTQYMNNNLLVNPGVTGIEEYLNVNLGYRNQWNGLQDAGPYSNGGGVNTFYLSAHQRLGNGGEGHSLPVRGARTAEQIETSNSFEPKKSPHGVGGYFYHDDQVVTGQNGVGLNYAYHMPVGQNNLSFGVSAGIIQYRLYGSKLNPLNPDNLISDKTMSAITPDLSAGVWFSGKSYYAGVGVDLLTQSKIKFNSATTDNKQNNQYYITGGYIIVLNESFTLLPSVLVKYVNPAPPSVDVSTMVRAYDKYFLGLSYRHGDAFALLAGLKIDTYQIGYSYDINTNNLSSYNNGTHEITLGLAFGEKAKNGKTLHW